MGAWGTGIFSDDLAKDVRFHFRDLIGNGYSAEEATKILVNEYAQEIDEEDMTVFWLALAAAQWKLGRLQEEVKQKAIDIIERGLDLALWEDEPQLKKKRQPVLTRLKEQLNTPQPPPKKISKPVIPVLNAVMPSATVFLLADSSF